MSRYQTHAEQQHAHVTKTHLCIGEGGRGWEVETKLDVVKQQKKEGRHKRKNTIEKNKMHVLDKKYGCSKNET